MIVGTARPGERDSRRSAVTSVALTCSARTTDIPSAIVMWPAQPGEREERSHLGPVDRRAREALEGIPRLRPPSGPGVVRSRVDLTVFVSDIASYTAAAAVHRPEFFGIDGLPASTLVEVSGFLLPEMLVSIKATAVAGSAQQA